MSCYPASFAGDFSSRFWGSAEYLYWWVKNSPLRVPLITANNNPEAYGFINEPGTTIIFGAGANQDSFNFGNIEGGRITIGGWIDTAFKYGLEVSAFDLPKIKQSYGASSINTNIPVINIPFNSGNENVLVNKNSPNAALISDTFQSYGFEINGLRVVHLNVNRPLVVLMGLRYVNIQENFLLNNASFPESGAGMVNVEDTFSTENHFYGAQVGTKTHFDWGRLLLDISATIALGNNHQVLKVSGNTKFNDQLLQDFGIFSEPSNLGIHATNIFSMLPELRIKMSYQFNQYLSPFILYDGFYINHVIRPGNEIDRNINTSQNSLIGGSGILVGFPSPAPQFKNTNMWMQGLSVGIDLKW